MWLVCEFGCGVGIHPSIHRPTDSCVACCAHQPHQSNNQPKLTVHALTLTGTGKTLLARVMAAEAGVPFIYCSGSDFVEMYIGRYVVNVHGWDKGVCGGSLLLSLVVVVVRVSSPMIKTATESNCCLRSYQLCYSADQPDIPHTH